MVLCELASHGGGGAASVKAPPPGAVCVRGLPIRIRGDLVIK